MTVVHSLGTLDWWHREVTLSSGLLGLVFNPTHGPGWLPLEVESLYSVAILFQLQAPGNPLAS